MPRASTFTVHGGLGFSLEFNAVLSAVGREFLAPENLTIGPLLQVGVSDDWIIAAPTLNARWVFDFGQAGVHSLKPFAQIGGDIAYIEEKVSGDENEAGVLINAGFGADYCVTDPFAIGSSFLFSFLPGDVQDGTFLFSCQILAATYHF